MESDISTNIESIMQKQRRSQSYKVEGEYRHWQTELRAGDVLWLGFDKNRHEKESTNTLGREELEELDLILHAALKVKPRALILQSLKQGGFCAGADIKQFTNNDPAEMEANLRQGHEILDRLEQLPFPTIAVLHGHVLGGGLELALACNLRIGLADKLQAGFPEIMLGLHPGLGGTFRLTRQVDPVQAMTLMLTGKSVHGLRNKKLGLIDEYIEPRHLDAAVKAAVAGKIKSKSQSNTLKSRLFSSTIGRKLAAKQMRKQSEKRAAKQHYPAPYALIDLWEFHGGSVRDMQEQEIKSFSTLMHSKTAQNLIRVFFLQQRMKKAPSDARTIRSVHVIGAGAMGGDIAAWCAMQGFRVTLSDQALEPMAQAVEKTKLLCAERHKSAIETRATLDRLVPDIDNLYIETADLIIEAIPEKLEIKQKLYKNIEGRLKPNAILASNTSSIPLDKLASVLDQPSRLLGLHFFNPVSRMQIVEAVSHDQTSPEDRTTAMAFAIAIGKLPVAVASYPGFLVNRALTPYLLEAILMLDEGIDKNVIDGAAMAFGMPMGPVELADQVGLDICLNVADMLNNSLDQPITAIPDWVQKKVEDGNLGKKTGEGFYRWKAGKAQREPALFRAYNNDAPGTAQNRNQQSKESSIATAKLSDSKIDSSHLSIDDITDRLILPMLNACIECHREAVIEDLDLLDGAMIFATGFAPFRGGPMHYARQRGSKEISSRLQEMADTYGERFQPDAGWEEF